MRGSLENEGLSWTANAEKTFKAGFVVSDLAKTSYEPTQGPLRSWT